jgi:hypothetical protein
MTTKLTSNYPGYSANDIPTNQKYITLRTAKDDPMSWAEFDNNFELLRYTVNSLVDDIAVVRTDVDYGAEIAVINENIQSNYSTLDGKFNDYLTIAVADATYFKKSDEIDAYTKTEVNTNFAAKDDLNDYVQTAVLDDYVTGDELTNFGGSYALLSDIPDAYSKGESDALYAPIGSTGSGGDILGTGIYYTTNMPLGRFEIQKGGGHPHYRATVPLWSSGGSYSEGDIVKVLDTRSTIYSTDGHYLYYEALQDNPTQAPSESSSQWKWTTSSYIPFYGEAGWPWNFVGTKAATVVQVHHDTDIADNTMEPGAVYDFEVSGNGVVVPEYDVSKSIHWGVQSSTRKYDNGSSQCFTAVGGLHEIREGGYNEVGLFQGECANLGSAHGTMSGVEVRCKDTDLNAYGVKTFSADTKMVAVIGRILREHDGVKPVHSFMASSEGSVRVDSCLTVNQQANIYKRGIDLSDGDFSEGAIVLPDENGGIINKEGWKVAPDYARVIPAGGPKEELTQSDIENLASRNVIALKRAVKEALVDPLTFSSEPQRQTGVVRLPAGRIYLNERIDVIFGPTYGHEFPNSITIKGEGQGNTQLVWTNNSSSQGLFIDIGPYGSIMNQKVNISDMDLVMGNQGKVSGVPVGVPVNQDQGLLGAKSIGIEITGDRTETSSSGAHAEQTNYSKIQGQARDPSLSIHYVSFKGWHWDYAGWNKGILIEDVQLVDIVGCCFDTCTQNGWNTSEAALHITGDAKCTDFYINQCRFFGYEYGILCDGNIEGVTIHSSTWVNSFHGVYWNVQRMVGGQAFFDETAGTFTSGSIDGTATADVAQWPLLVVTDCHINCIKKNIYISNGWQIMIKGCSFYGIDLAASYGIDGGFGFDASHTSIYVDNKSSNLIISNNTFGDTVMGNNPNHGGFGPSIEINGHTSLVTGNTFTIDPTIHDGSAADEPMVKLGAMASGNLVHSNMTITNIGGGQENGIPTSAWNSNLQFVHEDNNTGTYNGVSIVTNRVQNNF